MPTTSQPASRRAATPKHAPSFGSASSYKVGSENVSSRKATNGTWGRPSSSRRRSYRDHVEGWVATPKRWAMRAATGGPRSHTTPSRSSPQSMAERIPTGYDTNSLDGSVAARDDRHTPVRTGTLGGSTTGHLSGVRAERHGMAPRRPDGNPARWLLG